MQYCMSEACSTSHRVQFLPVHQELHSSRVYKGYKRLVQSHMYVVDHETYVACQHVNRHTASFMDLAINLWPIPQSVPLIWLWDTYSDRVTYHQVQASGYCAELAMRTAPLPQKFAQYYLRMWMKFLLSQSRVRYYFYLANSADTWLQYTHHSYCVWESVALAWWDVQARTTGPWYIPWQQLKGQFSSLALSTIYASADYEVVLVVLAVQLKNLKVHGWFYLAISMYFYGTHKP